MHQFKRVLFLSFVFGFLGLMSLWTFPHKAHRGIASFESHHYAPVFRYDPSYKM